MSFYHLFCFGLVMFNIWFTLGSYFVQISYLCCGIVFYVIPSLFKHMLVAYLSFFSIVPIFNLSLTATKMVDVKKECNVEFYHIISQYSSNIVWWTSIFYCSCIFQLCCEECMLGSCFDGKTIRVLYSQCNLQ